MIARYTHPEMGRIWSDQRRYETWLLVETAAAEAMADAGIVPVEAARDIRERGAFSVARIEEIEQITQHDVIAFTTAVAEHVGPSARWMHFGLTSSDVIDTAQALQLREACDVILKDLDALSEAVRERAMEHRLTAMIGRTHGVHAEPMTFGLKLALWYAELGRDIERIRRARTGISVGKLSGAVGTFAHISPAIEADVCARLGLEPAPVASQVIQRDRHAELLTALAITAASLEKFALEIRGLQKTEIGEVEEPFAKGQKGSSAMPHKRNPIGCEQIVGLARLIRGNSHAALENIALWHERDISHSSVERVILPDSFIAGRPHAAAIYPHRARHGGISGTHARKPESLARRRVFGHRAPGIHEEGRLARGRLRLGPAQRDALVRRAARFQEPAARGSADRKRPHRGRDRARVRSRRTIQVRRSHLQSGLPARARRAGELRLQMRARVFVTLKPSVFDPQGRTIAEALHSLGYDGVQDVRQGKYFELDLSTTEAAHAKTLAAEVADKLLANPVIESYRIEID